MNLSLNINKTNREKRQKRKLQLFTFSYSSYVVFLKLWCDLSVRKFAKKYEKKLRMDESYKMIYRKLKSKFTMSIFI